MRVETSVTFAADHPVFAGHFPGRPIVPGALLLDEVLHAALNAKRASTEGAAHLSANEPTDTPADRPMAHCQIASVKFLCAVQPGETLSISCTGSAQSPTRFDITCQGRQIATGTFVLEVGP